MCTKSEYSIISLLIPGPRSPGNDIDIYLQPLIDEIKLLWYSGVETFGASRNQTFPMRATIMWKSMTSLHMLSYLVGVQRESLLALVVTTTLILNILNIVGQCVIWFIVFLYQWILHGELTKDLSMKKLNLGLLLRS